MRTSSDYRLGSIWLVGFDPSIGTEIRKTRPAVIISGTVFNQRSKVTILPLTLTKPHHEILLSVLVPVPPSKENGLDFESFIVAIEPMTFDKRRLIKHLGQLDAATIEQAQSILTRYLDLSE
jgi:mRNA interferase MazF